MQIRHVKTFAIAGVVLACALGHEFGEVYGVIAGASTFLLLAIFGSEDLLSEFWPW